MARSAVSTSKSAFLASDLILMEEISVLPLKLSACETNVICQEFLVHSTGCLVVVNTRGKYVRPC